jgi:predicted RNA binding protein YcfA (HicA-like mRNA interferase family)
MVTRDFSGDDVAKVLVNVGPFYVNNVTGSHIILKCDPPAEHNTDPRTVSVPRHDRIRLGTLQGIADDAGAKEFDRFCEWIDRNR